MVTSLTAAAVGLPSSIVARSLQCSNKRQLRLGNRRLKLSQQSFVDDKRWQCRCFVEEVSHAWREWRDRNNVEKDGKKKKLPVVIFEGGRRWQYVFDGERIQTVEVDEEELRNGEGRGNGPITENVVKLKHTLRRIFVPDQVRPHYLVYLKWKLFHRFLSSILHFQCTQVCSFLFPLLLANSTSCSNY